MGSLQEGDEEVLAIRELMNGKRLKDLEVVPTARKALAEYLSRDPACEKFVEGKDGRLYHIDDRKGREIRQLVVPVACRGRLVVMKHAAQGHGEAEEVKHKLQKHYFWPSMNADTKDWIDACGCKQSGNRKLVGGSR